MGMYKDIFSGQIPEAYKQLYAMGHRETSNCGNCRYAIRPINQDIKPFPQWVCSKVQVEPECFPRVYNYEVCNYWVSRKEK